MKLKEFEKLSKNLKTLNSKVLAAGINNEHKYITAEGIVSVKEVAYKNEFGFITKEDKIVPARPFLRNAIKENKDIWLKDIMKQASKGMKSSLFNFKDTGLTIVENIKDEIIYGYGDLDPISKYTHMARGVMKLSNLVPNLETGLGYMTLESTIKEVIKMSYRNNSLRNKLLSVNAASLFFSQKLLNSIQWTEYGS